MIKKISFLILSLPVLYSVHAQNSSAFLKGGVNLANISLNENGNIDDANMLVSFHAGIQGDFPIASFLSLQPGVFVTGKGSKHRPVIQVMLIITGLQQIPSILKYRSISFLKLH